MWTARSCASSRQIFRGGFLLSSTDIGVLRLLDRGLRVDPEDVARAQVSFGDLLDLRDVASMCGIQTGKRCLVEGFVRSVQAAETRAGILPGVRGGGDFMLR